LREIVSMGVGSIVIVLITSIFVGAVTTIQTAYQLEIGFFPRSIIGTVVSASSLLEMAPSITALVLAGKVGSNIAGQIGTMRVTEQIDALEVMGVNSASYLILPKILAALFAFPCLVIIAAFVMHVGGILAGEMTGELNFAQFTAGARRYHDPFYVTFMMIKAVAFGFIIASVAAYQGYNVEGGAIEVGEASTRAVVISCIILLVSDYLLAGMLL
ncbi:MAG: ABC transporter permease, partial [Bacteroidia bacterium]|nr:ABC transporter permease [Bacteroidia bacterium]